jgi:hemerythrin-like domain-containing protein
MDIDVTASGANRFRDLLPRDRRERFRDPLAFLYAEHYRNRVICNTLDAASLPLERSLSIRELEAIVDFYTIDRPFHIADEEDSLFPLLRKRCRPSDNLPEILAQLEAEHRSDQDLVETVLDGFVMLMQHRTVANPDMLVSRSRAMADFQRRHLAWENGVVMPLAKRRLTKADLVDLARAMAERRGVVLGADD